MDKEAKIVEKKKKWIPYVAAGVAVILLATVMGGLFYYNSVSKPKKELQKQLELGEKYFSDLDYDNAILAYQMAISIDAKSEEAYIGLSNAYDSLIQLSMAEEDYDKASTFLDEEIKMLEEGVQNTGSEELKTRLAGVLSKKESLEGKTEKEAGNSENQYRVERHDYSDGSGYFEYTYDSEERLMRIASYYNDGNTSDVVFEYADDGSFNKISRYKNGQLTGYTLHEMNGDRILRLLEYDSNDILIKDFDYVYDDGGHLIKYPTTYLDYHYAGWEEVVEQYPSGERKKVIAYDENDIEKGTYCYDEKGNILLDEEGHPIKDFK